MKLKKVVKIKNTGILNDLDWSNFPTSDKENFDFKDINLIFGWNGTGKTTLSRILRNFELGQVCEKLKKYPTSEYEFELDDGSRLTQVNAIDKKNIRVFNKDFVEENIFHQDVEHDGDSVTPLFYLGEETIELTKERKEREEKQNQLNTVETDLSLAEKDRDKFATNLAKNTKDVLLGVKDFQNYHRDHFIKTFESIKAEIASGKTLNEFKLPQDIFETKLRTVKNSEVSQTWIEEITRITSQLSSVYITGVDALLQRTVSLQRTIEKLKSDWELSKWVQEGLKIHRARGGAECEFCGQILPENRISELEEHFSKDYTELNNAISSKQEELKQWKISNTEKIPNDDLRKYAKDLNEIIDTLLAEIDAKHKNLLVSRPLNQELRTNLDTKIIDIEKGASEINTSVAGLAKELETSLVSDVYENYEGRIKKVVDSTEQKQILKDAVEALKVKITDSERSLKDFKLPAKEINADLERFLGHSELKFEDKKDEFDQVSYEITRNGQTAFNLSEGEKTAISLIYFLRKLKENDFKPTEGVVFIDDPISSMDSQFLYSAYAFIISTIEEDGGALKIGQFFLSTHNYDFFNLFKRKYRNRLVKGFHEGNKGGYYMLRLSVDASKTRVSTLAQLDTLLRRFDSDYQYLYSKLIEFENADEAKQRDLTVIYPYPNIARRILETFLSFKYPNKDTYRAKIDATKISKEDKEAIYHFTNTESHGSIRHMSGFSSEILEPSAKDHVLRVLNLMREVDADHCSEMESSLNKG